MKRVKTLTGSEDLYTAAGKVFSLPPLETLKKGPDAVEEWREDVNDPLGGPDVFFEANRKEAFIITVASSRVVKVNLLLDSVVVDFGSDGSLVAAGEIIGHLEDLPRRSIHPFLVEFVDGKIEKLEEIYRLQHTPEYSELVRPAGSWAE